MNSVRLLILASLIGLAGCGDRNVAPADQPGVQGAAGTTTAGDDFLDPKYNLGDIETAVVALTTVAEASRSGTVTYVETETKKYELAMAEATVVEPYPAQLWIVSKLNTRRRLRTQDAILVKHRVFMDGREEPIGEKGFVWRGEDASHHPQEQMIDIMPLLPDPPGSVLIYTRAEIIWLPDTDAATVDPESNPETTQRVERLSNTLRVTFE